MSNKRRKRKRIQYITYGEENIVFSDINIQHGSQKSCELYNLKSVLVATNYSLK